MYILLCTSCKPVHKLIIYFDQLSLTLRWMVPKNSNFYLVKVKFPRGGLGGSSPPSYVHRFAMYLRYKHYITQRFEL